MMNVVRKYHQQMYFLGCFAESIREDIEGCDWEDIKEIKTIKIAFILEDGMTMHKDINVERTWNRIPFEEL